MNDALVFDQFLHGNPAQLKQAANGVLDQIVWATGTGGDAHGQLSFRQPVARFLFRADMLVVMDDQIDGFHLGRVLDEIRRQFRLAHFGEVRGVGGIISAHNDQNIRRLRQHFFQRILTILSCSTDRVEESEIFIGIFHAVFFLHGGLETPLHFLSFTAQHRGLIRHANREQVHVRIKPGGISTLKFFQELVFVAAVQDVIADVIRLREIEHHEVMSAAVSARL